MVGKQGMNNGNEITRVIRFSSAILVLIFIISMIPPEIMAVPDCDVDSGNYVKPPNDDSNKIVYYNFNYLYTAGNTYVPDDSGREKEGKINGCTQVSEKDNNINGNAALSFDGEDDYIEVNDSADFDFGYFVISALIRTDSTQDYLPICSKYSNVNDIENGYIFYLNEGQLGCSIFYDDSEVTIYDSDGDDIRDDSWHYILFESFHGYYKLFVDPTSGSYGEVESLSNGICPGITETPFNIGKETKNDPDTYYEGIMDCLYAYEIPPYGFPTPTFSHKMWGIDNVGYWPLDEGTDDYNFINDMVRYDYHSYGMKCGNLNAIHYCSDKPYGVPGTHSILFNGGENPGFIGVDDTANKLDFYCNINHDDLYLEFWFLTENNEINQMLIEKWDWGDSPDSLNANGYRIFLDYQVLLGRVVTTFEVSRNNVVSTVTANDVIQNNYWYHVWAWALSGGLYILVEGSTIPTPQLGQANSQGIGSTSNPLLFGCGKPAPTYNYDWPLTGEMDDIVIGHCYPR